MNYTRNTLLIEPLSLGFSIIFALNKSTYEELV